MDSLTTASELTGISTATLSRIENNKIAPTFSLVLKIMSGLKISWASLINPPTNRSLDEQISVVLPDATTATALGGQDVAPLHAESVLAETLTPLVPDVTARTLDAAGYRRVAQGPRGRRP